MPERIAGTITNEPRTGVIALPLFPQVELAQRLIAVAHHHLSILAAHSTLIAIFSPSAASLKSLQSACELIERVHAASRRSQQTKPIAAICLLPLRGRTFSQDRQLGIGVHRLTEHAKRPIDGAQFVMDAGADVVQDRRGAVL
jgi:hypothetical protein